MSDGSFAIKNIMASLVSYDISADHAELREILFMLGYKDRIPGKECEFIYFPDTTLYHASKTSLQVHRELEVMCRQLRIDLKRCVVTAWEDWAASCGEPSEN